MPTVAEVRHSNDFCKRLAAVGNYFAVVLWLLLASSSWCQSAKFLETKALAEKGDAKAQVRLGGFYETGDAGATKDMVEAAKWYRKCAEQGFPPAQFLLSGCYSKGYGVQKDDAESMKWLSKAAQQGYAGAQRELGGCYVRGDGMPKDLAEAVRWFRKAAEQGDAEAQFLLGSCYQSGDGVPKDVTESAGWFRKSAEQGHPLAECRLSARYLIGEGVPQDYVLAYKWANLAAAQGAAYGVEVKKLAVKYMTRDQIAEAQRLAREFKPGDGSKADSTRSPTGSTESGPSATGTGFFITSDGFLMTNAHVVKEGAKFRLVTAAGLVNATVVRVDVANDLALLKAEGRFTPLAVTTSRAVRLGSTVATVGFPNVGLQGFAPKLAKGEIAAMSGGQDDPRYFQISVPVQPGNSGGALVDERGNVVGIVSAKLSAKAAFATSGALPENVNYAVKSSFLLGFLESVPDVAANLKEPNTKNAQFEDVVKSVEQATVLVLVY